MTLSDHSSSIGPNTSLEKYAESLRNESITKLKITEDKEKNSKEKDLTNHYYLEVSYYLKIPPNIANGSGYYEFFVELIKENNLWKIKSFTTSP